MERQPLNYLSRAAVVHEIEELGRRIPGIDHIHIDPRLLTSAEKYKFGLPWTYIALLEELSANGCQLCMEDNLTSPNLLEV